jgi:hypothetical protein
MSHTGSVRLGRRRRRRRGSQTEARAGLPSQQPAEKTGLPPLPACPSFLDKLAHVRRKPKSLVSESADWGVGRLRNGVVNILWQQLLEPTPSFIQVAEHGADHPASEAIV